MIQLLRQKLKKTVVNSPSVSTVNYQGGFHYENGLLKFIATAEGYVNVTTRGYNYVYNYTDHLGNIRLSYTKNTLAGNPPVIVEENNYYPFGLKHNGYNNITPPNSVYKYKFNGMQLQDELGLNVYDFGARNYMPDLGRWANVDPLAEQFPSHSPYNYTLNNPLRYVDPDGRAPNDWIFHFCNGKFNGVTDTGKGNAIIFNIDGRTQSLNPRGTDNVSYFSAVTKYISDKVNPSLNASYKITPEGSKTGGYHTSGTNNITITDRSFITNNYYDVMSTIEHENDHYIRGPVKNFKDHVETYFAEAKSNTFQQTSRDNKASHAVSTAQRLLNAYVRDEIDFFGFNDIISEYNSLNPDFQLERTRGLKPQEDIIKVRGTTEVIKYDKELKPNE